MDKKNEGEKEEHVDVEKNMEMQTTDLVEDLSFWEPMLYPIESGGC